MADWLLPATRFALYLDLGLAFGWPAFCLYALSGQDLRNVRVVPLSGPIIMFGGTGLLLSLLGMAVAVASMSGTSLAEVDPAILQLVVKESSMGWASVVRIAALLLVIAGGLAARRTPAAGLRVAAAAGAVALATLAWNGHAGATEGPLGTLHLASDFLHLWAGGLWVAALIALLAMLARRQPHMQQLGAAQRSLQGFSGLGTVIVGTLVVTGIVNGAIIIGGADLSLAWSAPYARLLLIKLGLFGAMLLLAALNRFRLTPQLEAAIETGEARLAARALRRSLAAETMAALSILALVGWLGTLEPVPSPL